MKNSHILPLIFLLTASATFAQERPRYFDNFDTARGVQVKYTQPAVQKPREAPLKSPAVAVIKHYLPSPLVRGEYRKMMAERPIIKESPLVRSTVMSAPTTPGRNLSQASVRTYVSPSSLTTDIRSPGPSSNDRYLTRTPENSRLVLATAGSMRGHSTGDDMVDSFIVESSRRYNIDPLLIYAQMSQESAFKRKATSNKGASGLMQLMPATARRLGVTNIYDPQQNIEGGVKYMRILLNMFNGDVNLALAGYNAGEGAVIKYGYRIPPYNETQEYVRRISARYSSIAGATLARNSGPIPY